MRATVIMKEIDIKILMDLHIFSLPECEEVVWNAVCICLYTWMCTSVGPEWLEQLYSYSVFTCLSTTGQWLVNMNITAPKIWALQMWPIEQTDNFLKNDSDNSDSFSVICEGHFPK
jgi:hypothetical protein